MRCNPTVARVSIVWLAPAHYNLTLLGEREVYDLLNTRYENTNDPNLNPKPTIPSAIGQK